MYIFYSQIIILKKSKCSQNRVFSKILIIKVNFYNSRIFKKWCFKKRNFKNKTKISTFLKILSFVKFLIFWKTHCYSRQAKKIDNSKPLIAIGKILSFFFQKHLDLWKLERFQKCVLLLSLGKKKSRWLNIHIAISRNSSYLFFSKIRKFCEKIVIKIIITYFEMHAKLKIIWYSYEIERNFQYFSKKFCSFVFFL